MKKVFLLLFLLVILTGVSCIRQDTFGGNTSWVKIKPVQCLGNEWEKDWMADNPGERYDLSQEEIVIKEYYQKQGIEVYEYEKEKGSETVCAACTCPRGDTVYLRVNKDDISKMLDKGFGER